MRSLLLIVGLLGVSLSGQELIRLTTAETVTTDTVRVRFLSLTLEPPTVHVLLLTNTGRTIVHTWGPSPDALQMIRALNTANLSTRSLQQRILDRLVADGVIVGTVEGVPE